MSQILKNFIDTIPLENKPLRLTLTTASPTYYMRPGDTCIMAISSASDAVAIIYLPPKSEAVGKRYYINAPTGAAGGDISVYDREDGSEISTYGDLDADDDWCIYFCDGVNWRILKSGVA